MRVVSSRLAAVAVLLALGAALGPAGCVLFVPDEQLGKDCRFAGAGDPCGQCVSSHCQDSVNACCGDSTCATTLAALERCTTGAAGGCADLGATGTALGACVASSCNAACAPASAPDGGPGPIFPDASPADATTRDAAPPPGPDSSSSDAGHQDAGEDAGPSTTSCQLVTGTAKCTCDPLGKPNDVKCTPDTFGDRPNTLCYKTPTSCECAHMGCHSTSSNDCTCQLPDINPTKPTCSEVGLICCVADFGLCDCSNLDCGGAIQVASCTTDELVQLLPANYEVVFQCSNP